METLAFALEYAQQGFSVIPLKLGTKKPILGSWKPYQRKLAPKEQLEVWFSNGHAENNIAIVTGKISQIIAFDTDGEEALAHFNGAVESLDDEGLKAALKDTMRIKTASGNTNIVIGFSEREFALDGKQIADRVLWTNGEHSEIRLKGEGGFLVAPPSTLADGKRYELIDDKSTVVILLKTQINTIISAIEKQTRSPIVYRDVSTDARTTDLNEEDIHHIIDMETEMTLQCICQD